MIRKLVKSQVLFVFLEKNGSGYFSRIRQVAESKKRESGVFFDSITLFRQKVSCVRQGAGSSGFFGLSSVCGSTNEGAKPDPRTK